MKHPVFLDGPLEGMTRDVHPSQLDEGQVTIPASSPLDQPYIYNVTKVGVFGREVAVLSVKGGVPTLELLFEQLMNSAAKAAAE